MNKQIKKYVAGIAATVACILPGMQSCDIMDLDPTGSYSADTPWVSISKMDIYVKDFYRLLYTTADIANGDAAGMSDGVSDLIKYTWWNLDGGNVNKLFYQDNYINAESDFRGNWGTMYDYIRQFNEYFEDVSNGRASHMDAAQVKIRTAEVRFLRAYAYQELMTRYADGTLGVILRTSETDLDGPAQRTKARSTEAQCWTFILGEYDKAFTDLPSSWPAAELGRLTKGAALGMKARAALYAGRYQDAIDACDDILNPEVVGYTYDLLPGTTYNDYYKIFTINNNPELIIPVYFQQGIGMKQHNYDGKYGPPYDARLIPGNNTNSIGAAATPTEEYVSTFDIKVGSEWKAFDWEDLSDYVGGPYANREPRFYASILYNDAPWKNRNLELFVTGNDDYMDFSITGQDAVHKSTTGYIFRKFMKNDLSLTYTDILSNQYWIEMRLAEIYLIRSEAYARLNQFSEAYADLKVIRDRVGLPELPEKVNWSDYVVDLGKERICELGLEGHRYFDLVRWGLATETLDGKPLHGVKITKEGNLLRYEVVECDTQNRIFPERYTVSPIPRQELLNNTECVQSVQWR